MEENELQICRRLRTWREANRWTRASVARGSGISAAALAHIESGRAPLRYQQAVQISSTHRINSIWLATGKGAFNDSIKLPSWLEIGANPRETLSRIYDEKLREAWRDYVESPVASRFGPPADPRSRASARAVLDSLIESILEVAPDDRIEEVIESICSLGGQWVQTLGSTRREIVAAGKIARKEAARNDVVKFSEFLQLNPEMREGVLNEERIRELAERIEEQKYPQESLTKNTACRMSGVDELNTPLYMSRKTIRHRLIAALSKSQLTQNQAAKKWGINRRTLEDWIQGRREPRGLYREKIERALSEIEGPDCAPSA